MLNYDYCKTKGIKLSPKTKMAELINSEPSLLTVLDRFGMRLGFGEDTVGECCKAQEKDAFTFLTICRIFLFPDYVPESEELEKVKITDVRDFLRNSHNSYKLSWLPNLEKEIYATLSCRPEAQKKFISEFFSKFKNELSEHFELEEKKIFPFLDAISKRRKTSVKLLKEEHNNLGEKIQDIINLLLLYLPYEKSDNKVTLLLSHLYFFKNDLYIHYRIENHIILPLLKDYSEEEQEEQKTLSPREKEILICVAKGMLNKEIANLYNISIFTVMTHRKNITAKTGIKSIAGLTAYAIVQGLIDIEDIK